MVDLRRTKEYLGSMMNASIVISILAVLVGFTSSQVNAQSPPDLVILKHNWSKVTASKSISEDGRKLNETILNNRMGSAGQDDSSTRAGIEGLKNHQASPVDAPTISHKSYQYRIIIKNNGSRAVKSFDWQYQFLDEATGKVVKEYSFKSKVKIEAGAEKVIDEYSDALPAQVINIKDVSKAGHQVAGEQVVVRRIRYADGSSWERP